MAKRKEISKKIRFEVFKRDSFTCQYCGKSAPDVVLQVDHIVPVAKGGDNDITNLVTSCFECNNGKRDQLLSENQTIQKQKMELDRLNDRREQLEMMSKWRTELLNVENEEIDKMIELLEKTLDMKIDWSNNERAKVKRMIKKYNFHEVLDGFIIAYEKYDNNKVFNKITVILKNIREDKEHPELKSLNYITGILRNRFNYYDYNISIKYLKECYQAGLSIETLKEIALNSEDWGSWATEMDTLLRNIKNKDNEKYTDEEMEIMGEYDGLADLLNVEKIIDIAGLNKRIELVYTKAFLDLYERGLSEQSVELIANYSKIFSYCKDDALYKKALNNAKQLRGSLNGKV